MLVFLRHGPMWQLQAMIMFCSTNFTYLIALQPFARAGANWRELLDEGCVAASAHLA